MSVQQQGGRKWNDLAHVKPHLVLRSAGYRRAERNSSARARAKKTPEPPDEARPDAEVAGFLAANGLARHYPRVKLLGAVTPRELLELSPAELDGIGLKVLEKTRLLKALKSLPPPEMAGRILITAQRTGTEETAVHLKVAPGTRLSALRHKLSNALDVASTSITRLEYESLDETWYALVDEEDLLDALAEQPGAAPKLSLRVVCSSLPPVVAVQAVAL